MLKIFNNYKDGILERISLNSILRLSLKSLGKKIRYKI